MEDEIELVKGFLRCNGRMPTWLEWQTWPVETRAVFIEAAEQLDAERAALLSIAIRSEHGPELAFAKIDGGDSLVHNALLRKVADFIGRRSA